MSVYKLVAVYSYLCIVYLCQKNVLNTTDDTLVMDFRLTEVERNLLIGNKLHIHIYILMVRVSLCEDWRAGRPMVVYLSDGLPVESLAFPYIFFNAKDGTWRPYGQDCSLTLSEYARIRCLCYDSVASLDRSYIFGLYCEKVKAIVFDQKRCFFGRKGEFNKRQIVTGMA